MGTRTKKGKEKTRQATTQKRYIQSHSKSHQIGEVSVDIDNEKSFSVRSSVSISNTPSRSVSYQSSMDYPPKEGTFLYYLTLLFRSNSSH